ncbi:mediator of RNA polymerase II transcription subunit 15-like [Lepisosteus oculatus]|uniref:mediator of RNA polymerase II transcription subunit 15-like n=1 Tax=Lepisosteus oculatus TaxID=7918 RepID=UPI0035F52C0E
MLCLPSAVRGVRGVRGGAGAPVKLCLSSAAALRQWERRSARDQDREQQLRALREEQHQREAQDLQRALQRAEADRSLLLATVRQEGLLSQYRRNRTAARTAPPGLERAPLERPPLAQTAPPGLERAPLERPPLAQTAPPDLERPPLAQTAPPAREDEPPLATSPGQAQALRSSSRPQQRDSLSSVLEELQVLSLAVIDSGETSSEEEGDRKAAEGSLGSVGLFTNSKA